MTPIQLRYLPPAFVRDADVDTWMQFFVEPSGRDVASPDVVAVYEHGDAVAFSGGALSLPEEDWHFLNSLPVVPPGADNVIKKAKLGSMLAALPKEKDAFKRHVLGRLGLSRDEASRLQGVVRTGTDQLRALAVSLFPGYRFIGEDITWRLTETVGEEMHYDSYGDSLLEHHHVRLFVNIDTRPRLWRVSRKIDTTIRAYPDRLLPHRGLHPNQFNDAVNKNLPWAEIPRHTVAFLPGNAWLVNSQVVAHEVVYGRRMIACTFNIDPASMRDPSLGFNSRVRSALAEAASTKERQ